MIPLLRRAQWLWLGGLAVALVLAQIDQPYPDIAPLQHIPTLIALLASPWLLKRWPVSDRALGCIVVFLLLHTLGGRYTYSNVPYVQWWHSLTGGDFAALTGWHRNAYDRLVHFAFGLLSPSPALAWPLLLIPNAMNILWLGPVTTAVQHLVPRHMRATASGSFLLINNLIGLGVGPLLMGTLSDMLKSTYGIESLRYAAVGCLAFYGVAALLMTLAIRPLRRDWVEDVA